MRRSGAEQREEQMTREEVAQVREQLLAEGLKPTVKAVRGRLGYGSDRDISQHLRSLGEGSPLPPGEGEEEADDDDAGDVVALAEAAVAQAQRRLQALEDAVPLAEESLAQARSVLLNASGRQLVVQHAVRKDWLPGDDPAVAQAEAAMTQAGRRFREVTAKLKALPHEIKAAQAAVRVAEREAYLARQHADLVERRAVLQAEAPEETDDPGVNYRRKAVWKQEAQAVQAEIDTVLAQAGL
jgi:Plasmid replication region DNA-binding N-term